MIGMLRILKKTGCTDLTNMMLLEIRTRKSRKKLLMLIIFGFVYRCFGATAGNKSG